MALRWALVLTLYSATLLAPVRPALADPGYQQMADDAEANISAQIGRSLSFPIVVVLADKLPDGPEWNEATLAWTWPVWDGADRPGLCPIRIPTHATQAKYQPVMRWAVTHEVWHCFQAALVDQAHYAGAHALPQHQQRRRGAEGIGRIRSRIHRAMGLQLVPRSAAEPGVGHGRWLRYSTGGGHGAVHHTWRRR
jgi:hypothetical protein